MGFLYQGVWCIRKVQHALHLYERTAWCLSRIWHGSCMGYTVRRQTWRWSKKMVQMFGCRWSTRVQENTILPVKSSRKRHGRQTNTLHLETAVTPWKVQQMRFEIKVLYLDGMKSIHNYPSLFPPSFSVTSSRQEYTKLVYLNRVTRTNEYGGMQISVLVKRGYPNGEPDVSDKSNKKSTLVKVHNAISVFWFRPRELQFPRKPI